MGRIGALFKSDGAETASRYSISEWRLDARTQTPRCSSHVEDDVFYVTQGTMSVLVGGEWIHAAQGSFVLVPGGTIHDFENRTDAQAAVLDVSIPGEFEPHMHAIVEWFATNPAGDAGT